MQEKNIGSVVQIIGPVLDIRFPAGHLPDLLNAIEISATAASLSARSPSSSATMWSAASP